MTMTITEKTLIEEKKAITIDETMAIAEKTITAEMILKVAIEEEAVTAEMILKAIAEETAVIVEVIQKMVIEETVAIENMIIMAIDGITIIEMMITGIRMVIKNLTAAAETTTMILSLPIRKDHTKIHFLLFSSIRDN